MYELHKKFTHGVLFSNTSFVSEQYSYLPKECIYENYDENVLKNLVNLQVEYIRKGIESEAFVIFDDCMEKNIFTSHTLRKIYRHLRNFHITTIISVSHIDDITPEMKSLATGAFIFPSLDKSSLKSYYDNFGLRFGSRKDFKKYAIECENKEHNFIYYNKNINRKSLRDDIYKTIQCPATIPDFNVEIK